MPDKDFDEKYQDEVARLVAHYEAMINSDSQCFFEESSFEQIIEYYEEKQKDKKATEVVDLAIAQYPFSAYFLVKKAQFLFDHKQFDQALELLDKAQIFDPQDMSIFLQRSDIYVWLEDYRSAIETIQSAIEVADEEDVPDLYLELADIYEEWEKYPKVYSTLKRTLKVDPENEEALNRMWFCTEFTENYEDSIEFHKQLIDEQPYNFLAWFNLAHAYSGLNLYEKAVEAFEFVTAINEKYEFAYKDCGDVLYKMEAYDRAIDYYDRAIKLSRPSKDLYFNMGECYECLGNYNKARYYYRKAINLDPHFDEAFFKVGLNFKNEGRWSSALSSFERAYLLNKDNAKFVEYLAEAYAQSEDVDQAALYYRKAVDLRPAKKESWVGLCLSLFETGDYREALNALTEAMEHFIDVADLYFIKSALYYQIGNRNEAFFNLETGMMKDDKDYTVIFDITPHMKFDPAVINIIDQYSR